MTVAATPAHGRIREVVVYFLRLGLLGFGGPVALVGQMERELVAERKWLTNEQMREAIAICQSLPGPLAIQVGIYVSYLRTGFWGAWAGGWAFIFPNFVIVAALGALYVHLGDLQPVNAIFYGVSPAVITLILHSCYRLAKLGMDDWLQWAIAVVCLVVTVALASGGGIAVHWRRHRWRSVLRGFVPSSSAGRTANNRSPGIDAACTGRNRLDPRKASTFLPQSRLAHVRQRPRDRALPRAGARERIRLARSAAVPGRCCDRDDQPRPRGDHCDLRWLPGRRLLGIARLNDRNLFPVLHSRAGSRAASGASQRQSQCPRLREGCLWRRNRNDPGRLRPARANRHRRLADRSHRGGVAGGSVPLESEQSTAHGGDSRGGPHRIPTAAADMGDGQIAHRRYAQSRKHSMEVRMTRRE